MPAIVFTPAARVDVIEASEWYEARHSQLAGQFVASLDQVMERIAGNPLQFAVVHKGLRRALMRRFPYGVFCRLIPDQVQVIAVLHTSRNPRNWLRP